MIDKLYNFRFELFFFSLTFILFGSILFPNELFESFMSPILFIINLLSGILMISKTKKLRRFFLFLLFIIVVVSYRSFFLNKTQNDWGEIVRLVSYFVFYVVVTSEIIRQVWQSKIITKNVIIGLISGYICIGLIGFFLFLTIELLSPGSFRGVEGYHESTSLIDSLLYFSYITLLTIGYGEITPVTLIAQKATILTGLTGQFYLVILTATIIGKYISQSAIKEKRN